MASTNNINLSNSDVNRVISGRKRSINVDNWKNVKNKKLRNSGKEYTSRRKVIVPAKTPPNMQQVCDKNKCPWQQCVILTLARKIELFNEFYNLTYDEQSALLISYATSRRFCSFKYYIDDSQVCKNTFLNTFNITRRRVMTLQDKIKSGILIPRDGRGKHSNRLHAIDASVKDLIRQHINSLPRQPSHYSRLTTDNLQCLCSDLNLSADTEEERKNIEIDSMLHHSRAEQSYDALKKDTEFARLNSSTVVLCVDLQQVLFYPTLTHSNMFYQRQLSNYNFAIHNMGNNAVSMHLWYECIAKRGSLEIASCILNFIESNYNILGHGEERKLEKPFTIVEMSQVDFKDFSSLERDMTKKNLKITQAMWLKLSADAPMHVSIRESHNTLRPWKSHEIRHKNFGEDILSIKDLPPAYQSPLALTKEKKKDLLDMCKYIPQRYSDFFKSLPG
ncbi:hypothetical protein QTP88_000891 [Uroleucon formosanum]